MKKIILGICGFAGSGKSTVADILEKNHGFQKISFAGPLKDMVSAIFHWDREMLEGATIESRQWREGVDLWWSNKLNIPNLTPRLVLQIMGTEVMRLHYHNDIWINSMEKRLLNNSCNRLVITDCRFPNELNAIRRQNGDIVYVSRLASEPLWFKEHNADGIAIPQNVHISETAWIKEPINYQIFNDFSLFQLEQSVKDMISVLEK